MPELAEPRRVGLLFQSFEFHHKIFVGVLEYARLYRNWAFERSRPEVASLERFAEQGVEGVIGQLTDPALIDAVRRLGVPAVNISDGREVTELPNVLADDFMIGQLAADHLFARS